MTIVTTDLSTSIDGFIAGVDDSPERPLGIGGDPLFEWFSEGDTASRYYPLVPDVSRQRGPDRRVRRPGWRRPCGPAYLRRLRGVGRNRTAARRPALRNDSSNPGRRAGG